VHLDGLAELLIEAEADEHGHILVNLQPRALAKLPGVLDCCRGQPQAAGELVKDLTGGVLDVQPEGLACLNELCHQRRGRLPDHLGVVIDPALLGGLPDPLSACRLAESYHASSKVAVLVITMPGHEFASITERADERPGWQAGPGARRGLSGRRPQRRRWPHGPARLMQLHAQGDPREAVDQAEQAEQQRQGDRADAGTGEQHDPERD
jgi:hypothetical protein